MTAPPLDYPDPIVVSYMDRVKTLSPPKRASLDQAIWPSIRDGDWLLVPRLLYVYPGALLTSWVAMRAASRTDDAMARVSYKQFWSALRSQRWTLMGRQRVAWGLFAIRLRAVDNAKALSLYRQMDGIIPHESIGWAN